MGDSQHPDDNLAVEQLAEELRVRAEQAEEEIAELRRRLQEAPQRVRSLEERLLESKGQLSHAVSQNEKLTFTLQQAKEHIAALRDEVEKLTQPPAAYGTYLQTNDDGTVDVFSSGRKMRVSMHPDVELDDLRKGQEVVLNESLNVILARDHESGRRGRHDRRGARGRPAGPVRRAGPTRSGWRRSPSTWRTSTSAPATLC